MSETLYIAGAVAVVVFARAAKKNQRARHVIIEARATGPDWVKRKLVELARRSKTSLVITSWLRTPRDQARAMLAKVNRGEDLYDLYRDDVQIEALYNTPQTVDDWADTLRAFRDRGRPISRHMSGRGTDIRTRGMPTSTLARVMNVAAAMGANVVLESDHLHLGWPSE